MSSPLDGRIRMAAREAAAELLREGGAGSAGGVDAAGLQQQITDLHEHLHHAATAIKHLEVRIEGLEKADGAPVRQARRKTIGE